MINFDQSKILLNYIYKKAIELAKFENIDVVNVSFDEINKDIQIEKDKSPARFIYLTGNDLIEYEAEPDKLEVYGKLYPRIELTEKATVFDFIHEIGHYFIYKNGGIQSELKADSYFNEFFDKYLPPFFKLIYKYYIEARIKKKIYFSNNKKLKFYTECKIFIKNQKYYI